MRTFGDTSPIRLQHQDSPDTIGLLVNACLYPHKTFSTFTYKSIPRGTDKHKLEHTEIVSKYARYFINLAKSSKGCVFPFIFFSTNQTRPHAHAIITSQKPLPFKIGGKEYFYGDRVMRPIIREIGKTEHQHFNHKLGGAFYQSSKHIQEYYSVFTPSNRTKPLPPFSPDVLKCFQESQTIKALKSLAR